MSGGHFDYAYSRVSDFADDLARHLDQQGKDDAYGGTHYTYPEEVNAELRRVEQEARLMSRLMRAAEWLASGDYGDESFLEEVKEARKAAR